MSFDVNMCISEEVFSEEKYLLFLEECKKIKGKWEILETHGFRGKNCNCNRNEAYKKCYKFHEARLYGIENEDEENEEIVGIWIYMFKQIPSFVSDKLNFDGSEKYKIYIDIETGAGRSFLELAIQLLIAHTAFIFFNDVVVVDESSDDIYLTSTSYIDYTKKIFLHRFLTDKNVYNKYFLV